MISALVLSLVHSVLIARSSDSSVLRWLHTTELNNAELVSGAKRGRPRANPTWRLGRPGGLFKMAGICGIFPYGKQTRWLSTVLRG